MTKEERIESHRAHRLDNTLTALKALRDTLPEVHAQNAKVVGRWIWVSFEARPPATVTETLFALGYRWNRTRSVWQHCGGHPTHHSAGDPRDHYGERRPEELEQATA